MAKSSKWSGEVTKKSNALDLEPGVFTWKDPRRIANSLKKSSEKSTRRKANPYASAMSMLNFYINRAGKNLHPCQKQILQQAKDELRKIYHRQKKRQFDAWLKQLIVVELSPDVLSHLTTN